jgi:hypothetical protein
MRFGELTVVERFYHKNGKVHWKCLCDCGKETICQSYNLKSGHIKTCGCKKKEALIKALTRHGMTDSRTYSTWLSMISRCRNKKEKNYGGRGIVVCDKWLNFEGFYEDMGEKPEGLSLDRINNNGNYCKENCRWATSKEQCNNTRRNVNITYNGKTQNLTQWAEELNIKKMTLHRRLNQCNWSVEKAFTTKVRWSTNKSEAVMSKGRVV